MQPITPGNTLYFFKVSNTVQMYQILFITSIPDTRLFSFHEYKKYQNGKRKDYILTLLAGVPAGLSCREISDVSGIWVQSLTNPLKELEKEGLIKVAGVRKSTDTNRLVQVYTLNQ